MSRGTAYYDLPNGERIELPTTMPDVEEVPGPLCDGKFELPEAVKEMFKWMDETFGTWESDFSSFKNLDEIAEKLQSTGALGSDAGQASKPKAFRPKHLFI